MEERLLEHVDDTLEALTKYKEILEHEAAGLGALQAPLAGALGRKRLEEAKTVQKLIEFYSEF